MLKIRSARELDRQALDVRLTVPEQVLAIIDATQKLAPPAALVPAQAITSALERRNLVIDRGQMPSSLVELIRDQGSLRVRCGAIERRR